jgi:glycosyltransferase involved in cell wall biosynthesis
MFYTNLYAAVLGAAARVRVRVGSLRGRLPVERETLGRPLATASLFSVQHMVVNSKAALHDVVSAGYPRQRVTLLDNCVQVTRESPGESASREIPALGIKKDDLVIGAVGNLRPEKAHHLLVSAVAKLIDRFPSVRALIVGRSLVPSVRDELLKTIAEARLNEHVILAGLRTDVPLLMNRFDVFCMTSENEGSPNVILEAMVARRPIVATSVGGIPELITHGVNGLLVPSGDAGRIAGAIALLLDNPDLARRLGDAGREAVEARSCQVSAERLGHLYRRLHQ